MIGRNGERGSGISVLAVRHDDDDDVCLKSKRAGISKNGVLLKLVGEGVVLPLC